MSRSTILEQITTDALDVRITALEGDQHVAVTLADVSLEIAGQVLNVNLDTITGGGDNVLTLTPNGLYVSSTSATVDLALGTINGSTVEVTNTAGTNVILPAATTLLAGLLTGTDKTKLDGIETGATADQDAADVPITPAIPGLTATDAQAAFAELQGDINSLAGDQHVAVTLGGVPSDTTDDTLDLTGQVITVNLATITTDGAMSASDKVKLDGIETGANNYIHPNHSGDVVSVGDGAQTIQPNVVDNTKLADVSTQTIKGRTTAGSGDPEDLTPTQVRTLINVEDGAQVNPTNTDGLLEGSTNLYYTETRVSANTDVAANTAARHDAVTLADVSLEIAGQILNVNLDTITGGGDNVLTLTANGLYVSPSVAAGTNLGIAAQNINTLDITSSTGTDVTVPTATTLLAGLFSGTDKSKLDGIAIGANNYVHPNHSGDVVSVGDGVQTIQLNVVSNGELADMLANTMKTRASGTAGDPIDLLIADGNMPIRPVGGNLQSGSPTDIRTLINVEDGASADQDAADVPITPAIPGLTATDAQAAFVELQGDINSLVGDQHVAVTLGNDGLSLTGQVLSLNIDGVTAGNIATITAVEGLYIPGTDLSLGTITATTVPINSSTGTDIATLPLTTATLAGILSASGTQDIGGTKRFQSNVVINDQGVTIPAYDLSVQDGDSDGFTYIEILHDGPNGLGGADTGAFFGMEDNGATLKQQEFTLYNWNGGDIVFYTDTVASSGQRRFIIENDGTLNVGDSATYELQVTDDDDIPNKKYVDDEIVTAIAAAGTDLSVGTVTATNVPVNSSTGADITTLPAATDTLAGIVTANAQSFGGTKTFVADKILIDPIDAGSPAGVTLEIGWFNDLLPNDPNSFGFRRSDGGGVFSWGSNANFPQFFLGSPTGTGSAFIDATNNTPLNLNVLDTGADDPGVVNIGIGGLVILGSSEVVPTSPLTVFRDDTVAILSLEVESDGTITAGNTVTYENLVLADNDIPNRKWVADRLQFGTFPAARNATITTDQGLRRQNGVFITSLPYYVPFDAEIYKITAENNPTATTQTWDLVVEVNTVVVATISIDNAVSNRTISADLDINIDEDDEVIIFFRNASAGVPNPGGIVYFRSRI